MSEHGPTAQGARAAIDPWVFFIAAGISLAFVLWGVIDADGVGAVADDVLTWIISTFGWVFVIGTAGFLVFAFVLAFSRFGKVRLGRDDDRPEFRTVSWIAMMFSAGMGIGLMFYAVAEPISHMTAPPAGTEEAGTAAAAQQAMSISYFHWALHPWAIYAIVGLALAYFTFRKGMPNLISSAFYPLLGDRVKGPIGRSIDILAIFATLFGSATSLGLGALQINSGLDFLWGVEPSDAIAVTIIAVLTLAFVLSAVSGVHRGIQWLSNGNMILAILLVLFLLIVGPTVFQFETLVESIGGYATMIVPASFRTGAFGDSEWLSSWTIFYWAWWISWAPFVGTFIARISKGRTVRQFVVGVLGIPSGVSFVWFAVFGGAAIDLQLGGTDLGGIVGTPEIALFTMLEEFPLAGLTSFVVDRAGGAVLRQRRGRRVAGDGHAVLAREPHAFAPRGHRVGRRDRRVGRGPAAGRRPQLAPAGRDHRRRAVHDRDGRALHIGVQGARRGGGAADHPRDRPRAHRARAGGARSHACPTTHSARSAASSTCSPSSTACASTGRRSSRPRAAASPRPGSRPSTSSPAARTS